MPYSVKQVTTALLLLLTTSLAVGQNEYYVSVTYDGVQSIRQLVEQGFDVGGINLKQKRISLIVKDWEMKKTQSLRVLSKKRIGRPDKKFKNPSQVESILVQLENDYPHLATVEKIGTTTENRPIFAVRLTSKLSMLPEKKPVLLIDAMHHAREVMTVEVALDLIEYLTSKYATDTKVQKWLNNYEVWVVPMLNPDGNNRVWTNDTMWRKNTNYSTGVDVNRNYPYAWNSCSGSSGNPYSDQYRGPTAGSEPETNALMQLVSRIQPKFSISYHSYSEMVLYPFGCSSNKMPEPDRKIYQGYGKAMARTLITDSDDGNYDVGTPYQLLYNVDGGSVDWMYDAEKVMAYVIEVNSSDQGFQPDYDEWRDITVKRQRAGWQYLLEQMNSPGIKAH